MKERVRLLLDGSLEELAENVKLSETLEGKVTLLRLYRESLSRYFDRIETSEDRAGYIRHLDAYIELSQGGGICDK